MAADRVFLTGATGFVGGHVLRTLLERGYAVRALVRDASVPLGCETVTGDLTRSGELVDALRGCRYVVHCAALYSFTPRDRASIYAVNVAGTAGLLAAADRAGVERAVVTSSSATLGAVTATRRDDYHSSKLLQEHEAFSARVPVIAVLPTAPVGPGDWKPTPTGKMIVDFARGAMFAKPPGHGGMNLVAVEDVAEVHVSALERGRAGERYVAGGENMTFDELWQLLAELTGRKVPSFRAPFALALAVAYADELRCRVMPDARPFAPLEGVHLSTHRMFADSSQAIAELGYHPQPVRGALERALAWYRAHGYCA